MANKYYGAALTLTNRNFYEECKKVSAKMTDAEIEKHPTLREIRTGVLAGKGFETVKEFQKVQKLPGDGKMNAETWYALFN